MKSAFCVILTLLFAVGLIIHTSGLGQGGGVGPSSHSQVASTVNSFDNPPGTEAGARSNSELSHRTKSSSSSTIVSAKEAPLPDGLAHGPSFGFVEKHPRAKNVDAINATPSNNNAAAPINSDLPLLRMAVPRAGMVAAERGSGISGSTARVTETDQHGSEPPSIAHASPAPLPNEPEGPQPKMTLGGTTEPDIPVSTHDTPVTVGSNKFEAVHHSVEALNATISKANNTNNLNLTSSWVGGAVPGSTDIARWDST